MSDTSKSSGDMWETARVIWENTPSMSDRDLLARMQELYGEKAPKTHSAITRRRNKEKWVKKSNLTKNSSTKKPAPRTKSSTKKKKNDPQNLENTGENNKESDSENQAPPSTTLTVWQEVEEKVQREAIKLALSTDQKAKIVIKHRKRLEQLGKLQENTIGVVNSLHGLDPKLDGDEIVQTIQIAETLSKTLKQLTDSQKVIAEQELPLSGITPEDFQQSESEKRQASIEALAGIAEQERENRKAKLPALMERLREIENMTLDDLDDFAPIDVEDETVVIDEEDWEDGEE